MAEFALGLTKTAVAGTVTRVKSAMEEESQLRGRVQEDLVFITGEFEMMQSFLGASNAGERASKNQVVRTWVRQLRDLALDVEDCVEFVLHLDKPSRWDWVWRFAMAPIKVFVASTPPLDQAVANIKRLKARVEDVSQRNTRYNLLLSNGNNDDSTSSAAHLMRVHKEAASGALHVLREVWKANGKLLGDHTTGDLKELMIHCQGSKELQVISLWLGGDVDDGQHHVVVDQQQQQLGCARATIMKKAYDDPDICLRFKNRAWVNKLPHPFNPVEFLNNLLTQFTSSHQHHYHDDIPELVRQVSRLRHLIILEQELSSVADWEAIRMYLPNGDNGSRIVVSTNHLGAAHFCTGDHYQVSDLKSFSTIDTFVPYSPRHQPSFLKLEEFDGFRDVRTCFALHAARNQLVERENEVTALTYFNSIKLDVTLSVWGIAGVGKSSIVNVPQPFNLTDLCQRLLLDFYSDDLDAKENAAIGMMEGQDPIQGCRQILRENRCLLVIDGLQSKDDWDLINTAFIATHCTDKHSHILNVKGLKTDMALDIFTKVILRAQLSSREAEISNLIMAKCGGLPEVIAAMGREWARADMPGIKKLEFINANFRECLETPSLRGLFCWMQSYFDGCSDEPKPCIFYLSVFPADQSIRRSRLMRRWIAEGYSSGGGGGTAEEKGEKLLRELIKLSILYQEQEQEQETSRRRTMSKVNSFFHGYIKSRPMEDNLVFALEGCCSPSSRLTGQHLTIISSWDRDETVFDSIDLSRLRYLTVFGAWRSFLISAKNKMEVLRVLDLEGTSTNSYRTSVTDDDLERIGKLLCRLEFLSLRGCRHITRLPDSLGAMRQLETLDVRHTFVVELPAAITKLQKLQYIRAGTTIDTSLPLEAPPPASATTTTTAAAPAPTTPPPTPPQTPQEGGGISLNHRGMEEQATRQRLAANGGGVAVFPAAAKVIGKLGLSGINRENWQKLCDAISGHSHLESLSLQLLLLKEDGNSFDFACFDDISNPPTTLKCLKVLYGTTGEHPGAGIGGACIRPVWIKQLPNLEKLSDLELTISSQEDIYILFGDDLPHGVSTSRLRIKPIQQQHLSFGQCYDTLSLDTLRIDCSSSTLLPSKVTFGEFFVFSVGALNIQRCGSSCLRISGLKHISGLKEVL
ncbi:hypothetical protein BRADI_1g51320v3, partial [Brachypodium distachyon]